LDHWVYSVDHGFHLVSWQIPLRYLSSSYYFLLFFFRLYFWGISIYSLIFENIKDFQNKKIEYILWRILQLLSIMVVLNICLYFLFLRYFHEKYYKKRVYMYDFYSSEYSVGVFLLSWRYPIAIFIEIFLGKLEMKIPNFLLIKRSSIFILFILIFLLEDPWLFSLINPYLITFTKIYFIQFLKKMIAHLNYRDQLKNLILIILFSLMVNILLWIKGDICKVMP